MNIQNLLTEATVDEAQIELLNSFLVRSKSIICLLAVLCCLCCIALAVLLIQDRNRRL